MMESYRSIKRLAFDTGSSFGRNKAVKAMSSIKEADLTTAVLLYAMRCLAEGISRHCVP